MCVYTNILYSHLFLYSWMISDLGYCEQICNEHKGTDAISEHFGKYQIGGKYQET